MTYRTPLSEPACVLFDLDGTLLDTAPDMAMALNRLRVEQGWPALPFERIRPVVSHGAAGLLQLGFGLGSDDSRFGPLRQRFLELYDAALAVETALFEGMEHVLARLESSAIAWGVVTNKPGWLTDPLLQSLGLFQRAGCVVSGDTVSRRKPDPEPLLHACDLIGIEPGRCLYLGDAERDVQAGNRAGMITLVARYGYLGIEDAPETWGAHGFVDVPGDLLTWLRTADSVPVAQLR
jgi:phosphoglycolate phosphatase